MKNSIPAAFLMILLASCQSSGSSPGSQVPTRPNILLIAVDDLRPRLNCYGETTVISPHIDALARDGILFTRAYTQQAVCAPSRNTLMTGVRPDGLGIHDLSTFFREKAPGVVTLPQHFMLHGYVSEGMGKIYHTGHGNSDDSLSWSNPHWTPDRIIKQREPMVSGDTTALETNYPRIGGKRIPWQRSSMPEAMHEDALVATHAIERLSSLKDTSFFLAVGFRKPHLPFVAPEEYWRPYDHAHIVPPPKEKPQVPPYVFANSGELRNYHGMPGTGYVNDEDAMELIRGYDACVSFIDAQIGRLISELKQLGLYDNTLIVLWGDHGWKLGDYGEWCKHTNFEIDTRIPVIIKPPGDHSGNGWESGAVIETVDIYPTLCELAGLEIPVHVQGTSFMPALTDREFDRDDVAFSQYPRTAGTGEDRRTVMGTSMRTADYRYTRWTDRESGEVLAEELYDHRRNAYEIENLAADGEEGELLKELRRRFETAYNEEHRKGGVK